MIWPIFKEKEIEELLKIMEKFMKDIDSPIDKEKYLKIQEQMGLEPDPKKIPLGFEDIPADCQLAFSIYTKLGNRVYGDVGYTGKDYTNLPILIEIHNICDKGLLIELLNVIEGYYIDKNQKQIKKMYDDLKKKK